MKTTLIIRGATLYKTLIDNNEAFLTFTSKPKLFFDSNPGHVEDEPRMILRYNFMVEGCEWMDSFLI